MRRRGLAGSRRRGGADGGGADDPAAVVDHDGLAGGDALGRVEQLDLDEAARRVDGDDGAVLGTVGAQLDGHLGPVQPVGTVPHQRGRMPLIRSTRSPSRGPTVTVPETGSMSSTKRGLPSGAGRPSRSPRRWPMV